MDNIDIRKSIISNFKDSSVSEIKESIEASIKDAEEITLPGMGVFFEIVWKEADTSFQNKILELIKQRVERGTDVD